MKEDAIWGNMPQPKWAGIGDLKPISRDGKIAISQVTLKPIMMPFCACIDS